ncbi:YycH family regulatory protein [Niallia sp. NCCP-28]|uniref:YycH family regulatory protein n=1 Tax=Niallia sp. NCCP-28 TaxID=2934712 RepID=UPI0020BF1F0B|nr:two-component system activity regulator YycH [Niallia sp. NCCP-28]
MTYEKIKTVILAILVLVSIFLYYILWTHQGNYETLKKIPTVEPEMFGKSKEIGEVVKPDRIYQHLNGQHYGTMDSMEISDVINTLKKWDYNNIKNISPEIKNISSFIQKQDHSMEIRFPGDVPFYLYKTLLNSTESNNFDFDTILISYDISKDKEGLVYFISRNNGKVYESNVSASFIDSFKDFTNHAAMEGSIYTTYFSHNLTKNNLIYLPKNDGSMKKYNYLYKTIDSAKLKRALFSDPSLVQKNIIANREEYTDDTGLLRIDKDTHVVSFLKPSEILTDGTEKNKMIQKSIEFVNQHGGWTNQYKYEYRYVDKNDNYDKTTFRLYNSAGFPIFDMEHKISDIQIVWENNDVKTFITSNLSTFGTDFDTTTTTLMSGQKVLEYLKEQKNIEMEKIQDIVMGYDMQVDSQSIVRLQPSWFYEYDEKWYQIETSHIGGKNNGLE